jgi:hypothetical protein
MSGGGGFKPIPLTSAAVDIISGSLTNHIITQQSLRGGSSDVSAALVPCIFV